MIKALIVIFEIFIVLMVLIDGQSSFLMVSQLSSMTVSVFVSPDVRYRLAYYYTPPWQTVKISIYYLILLFDKVEIVLQVQEQESRILSL